MRRETQEWEKSVEADNSHVVENESDAGSRYVMRGSVLVEQAEQMGTNAACERRSQAGVYKSRRRTGRERIKDDADAA